MEAGKSGTKELALSVEPSAPAKDVDLVHHEHGLASAHTIDRDSWGQVGLLLVTGSNCGYILSFSKLMLVPLGWTWGVTSMILVGIFATYANWLLAGFHFLDGQRFIRYRDLMGFVFGRRLFYLTWVLQFLNLVLGNMGFILLGGKALKAIGSELSGSPWRLQYFIMVTGVSFFIFSVMVPTISSMRKWTGISAALTFIYVGILLVLSIKDGKSNKSKDYDINGSQQSKVFSGFAAIAAILFCNTSGMLPEIQSTLRKPAVDNMRKALYSQYSMGLAVYYGVSILGYWAYGSMVSEYLPNQLNGPKWVKLLMNLAVFLQSIISQHLYFAPVHEALDTKFLNLDEGMHSRENIKRLIYLRAFVFSGNTVVTAALPFLGDFVNLIGSFCLIPLTFVFPSMIFIKIKGKTARLEKKFWHWTNIIVFSLLTIATTISAVRFIASKIKEYNFFADT